MKKELEQKFAVRWPKWFGDDQLEFGFQCGDGWFDLLWHLCEDLTNAVPHDFHVMQVKEKFGGLRFYVSYGSATAEQSDVIDQMINKAEDQALATCENCGEPGEVDYSRRWYRCRCLSCRLQQDRTAELEDKLDGKNETS